MNCCLQKYTTSQFTYFIYYLFQDKFKNSMLRKSNWNETEIYLTLWMWWRTWQTCATTMTQTMMKVTMTTLMMKTPLPKTKKKTHPTHT